MPDSPAPNPTIDRSVLSFAAPVSTHVRLTVSNVRAREIAVLADGVLAPGKHNATLDVGALRAGVYFVRMRAQGVDLTRRMTVLR